MSNNMIKMIHFIVSQMFNTYYILKNIIHVELKKHTILMESQGLLGKDIKNETYD